MKLTRWFIILILALVTTLASAQETNSSEQLTQWVGQLQKSPTDRALREKIIKLALELQPAPAVPPEARRPFVMGVTYQKEAKSPEDFGLAVKAFQDASAAAPWWGDAYYNLSVALESAKRYDEAKDALTLYLLTKPTDAEQAQERLYALDAKKVLAGKQQAVEVAKAKSELAAKETAAKESQLKNFEGNWYRTEHGGGGQTMRASFTITRDGGSLRFSEMSELGVSQPYEVTVENGILTFTADRKTQYGNVGWINLGSGRYSGTLSSSNSKINFRCTVLPTTPEQRETQEKYHLKFFDQLGGDRPWSKE